ncbi:ribosomal protein S5 domain 2-like protein [Clavulina sp. PMI_390]|nr:ribosomal protein S5 domain 2-like protein [Clavulina sp. PMI_390]
MPISKAESSFIRASFLSNPPQRNDGRALNEFRAIAIQAGGDVAPLANGSAKINLGGTEVIAAIKLEAENIANAGGMSGAIGAGVEESLGRDGGRVSCTVSCSQSAYPHKLSQELDAISSDLSALLTPALSSALTPSPQLTIVPGRKSWLLNIDALVLTDNGNIFDAITLAIRAALWDLRIPRTRGIEFEARESRDERSGVQDSMKALLKGSGGGRKKAIAGAEFDLEDYWDEGEHLTARTALPIGITFNLVDPTSFLDATAQEEESAPDRLHLIYSFSSLEPSKSSQPGKLHGFQLVGPGEVPFSRIKPLLAESESHARALSSAVHNMLAAEEAKSLALSHR